MNDTPAKQATEDGQPSLVGTVAGSGLMEIVSSDKRITGLRWAQSGRLQYCREERYEQWENGRAVAGGIRKTWHDVEQEPPNTSGSREAR